MFALAAKSRKKRLTPMRKSQLFLRNRYEILVKPLRVC